MIARHVKLTGPHTALDISMYDDVENPKFPRQPGKVTDRASMRQLIDGYDTAVRYVDDQVARIVAQLKAAGVYEETAIIISADHGENFGELGIYAEHGTADQGTCQIPMIIKWPGGRRNATDDRLLYNLDLAPTLMDLLGGVKQPIWDGASFASFIRAGDGDEPVRREDIVISQCCHVCQRSVRFGKWLYLRTYHDGFHLFPSEMLFDLAADSCEQHNLAPSRPDLVREVAWRLARCHEAQMHKLAATSADVTDPLWTVIREGGPFHARLIRPGNTGGIDGLRKYIARLETTGRADGAAALRARYAHML